MPAHANHHLLGTGRNGQRRHCMAAALQQMLVPRPDCPSRRTSGPPYGGQASVSGSVPLPAAKPLLRRHQRRILPAAAYGESAGGPRGGSRRSAAGDVSAVAAISAASIFDAARAAAEVLKLLDLLPPGLAEEAVSAEQLRHACEQVGEFGGDNRAGIDKTLHRISCICNRAGRVVGLTCRVGRAISGSAAMVADLAKSGKSILLLGRPGVGKTTAIREISRLLADDCEQRVVVVDTSNEIGGDGDIPHPGIGRARRMQVPQPEAQHRVMVEAVENHMPEVIVIDEIGTEAECLAARTIAQRGVQLVATAHGNELENVMKNPTLNDLVGGISSVTLGDEEAKRRGVQKSVLERQSPPTFDVCVEMVSREQWRVHLDVGWAVDSLLIGKEAGAEVRERDESGKVWSWPEGGSMDFEDDLEDEGEEVAAQRRSSWQWQKWQQVETQPFPAEALITGRMGAAMEAAEAGVSDLRALAAVRGGSRAVTKAGTASSKAPGSSKAGTTQAGSKNSISSRSSMALHVYPFGIDDAIIDSIAESLGLSSSLVVAERIQDADTVLALRSKIKTSSWIKEASKAASIPVYSVKTASVSNLVRAVRTLLGIDPSPGAMFNEDAESPAAADPRARSSNSRTLRPEISIALAAAAMARASGRRRRGGAGGGGGAVGGSVANVQDALEEARLAAEQIVIPRCQPVELLPRELGIIDAQVQLVEGFGLPYEVVGSAASLRLRVLPPAWATSTSTSGTRGAPSRSPPSPAGTDAEVVVASGEGAAQKDYW